MTHFIFLLDILGIVAFAATGAMLAARKEMDVFGALVLAFVTGIGGGTLRDLILDVPVFWLTQPHYLWACLAGFLLVYIALYRFHSVPRATINFVDAVGLGVFTVLGAQKTLALGHNEAVAVIMGMLTGCGGGMIRDVLANQVPIVLSRKRLYATASLLGGLIFVIGAAYSQTIAMVAGFAIVMIIRIGALLRDWRLPFFPVQKEKQN
jgi:uncharacterized membrane protein YeiH